MCSYKEPGTCFRYSLFLVLGGGFATAQNQKKLKHAAQSGLLTFIFWQT